MRGVMKSRRLLVVALAWALTWPFAERRVHAYLMASYDIDTLVDRAALAVEAEIIAVKGANADQVQVRIGAVHRGTEAGVGDTLLVAVGPYKKPGKQAF